MKKNVVYFSLGSNVGDKEGNMKNAVAMINKISGLTLTAKSSLYQTDPVGYKDQDWFLNAVIRAETKLGPRDLLNKTQEIENMMGRKRLVHWGPRNIDIDLLLFNAQVLNEPGLIIPHPEMAQRRFVLVPLGEIDLTVNIPYLGTVGDLLNRCPEEKVILVKAHDQW